MFPVYEHLGVGVECVSREQKYEKAPTRHVDAISISPLKL
jgi:hypothetical protein